jgi:hypothetical protein
MNTDQVIINPIDIILLEEFVREQEEEVCE